MATSLLELLTSQQNPQLRTRCALLILDLQHDFVDADGRLVVNLLDGFQTSFKDLVAEFRNHGDVIWTKTKFTQERLVHPDGSLDEGGAVFGGEPSSANDSAIGESDDSEDEFLQDALRGRLSMKGSKTSTLTNKSLLQRMAARSTQEPPATLSSSSETKNDLFLTNWASGCQPVSTPKGSEYASFAQALIEDRDTSLTKSHYSAFAGTNLLTILRSKLITELFVCGTLTNVSVFSTASDAARHGLAITLLEDCLGYRSFTAHTEAVKHLVDYCGAQTITSSQLLVDLNEASEHVVDLPLVTHGPPLSQDVENLREESPQLLKQPESALESTSTSNRTNVHRVKEQASTSESAKLQSTPPRDPNVHTYIRDTSPALTRSRSRKIPNASTSPSLLAMNGYAAKEGDDGATFDPSDLRRTKRSKPTPQGSLGPKDILGEGDSRIVHDETFDWKISQHLKQSSGSKMDVFTEVKNEVHWQKMYHVSGEVPRLVCAQGKSSPQGGSPIYRHPADQSLPLLDFSPTVDAIRRHVEEIVGHQMNHVLIQLYRGGHDYISEHSDKSLDIVRDSFIVNVSLGAMRTMRLRTKRPPKLHNANGTPSPAEEPPRTKQLVQMPHGSTFVLGLQTNMKWLHSINQDRRRAEERSPAELAYDGERISLTFRNIGTFLSPDSGYIWGQGAVSKDPNHPNRTINGDETQTTKLVHMFGTENQSTDFDWDSVYGSGSDVLHFSGPSMASELPMLFLSEKPLHDLPVRIYLQELDIAHKVAGVSPHEAGTSYTPTIMFRNDNAQRTQIEGTMEVLLYLERYLASRELSRVEIANATHLLFEAVGHRTAEELVKDPNTVLDIFERTLSRVEDANGNANETYLAGSEFGVADAAFFPIVDEIFKNKAEWTIGHDGARLEKLGAWHQRMMGRTSISSVMRSNAKAESGTG